MSAGWGTAVISSEKKAVGKFFVIYFFSVALLIVGGAVFYYVQQQQLRLHHELFSMLQYAKTVKFSRFEYAEAGFHHRLIVKTDKDHRLDNIVRVEGSFHVMVPTRRGNSYLLIQKDAASYDAQIRSLLVRVISVSMALLLLFSLLSYYLASLSIRPLKDTISMLDAFIKDLVHDLNTPTTSILLNIKMLKTKSSERDPQRLERIEEATNEIASLYKNLAILLDETKLTFTRQDVTPIILQRAKTYRELYPHLRFTLACEKLEATINPEAFSQMIGNIISNACKYNKPDGYVTIKTRQRQVIIEDGGIGMKMPQKVFDRYYTESLDGHGIGMHIVSRLAKVMRIDVRFDSVEGEGSRCILTLG